MSEEVVIKVEHVSKNFVLPHERANSIKGLFTGAAKRRSNKEKETQHALKDINFEVKKGEFFGIVGRNGSGKSTLLKILAGIYQPTDGKVSTSGKLVPFIELGVGFNPELTGRENVYLNGAMLGFSQKEVEEMYDDIVYFAELEDFMDQKLKNYSSGMQVRLAFSMAVRAQADVLIVDEVLAVGDADFQRKCFDYFKKLKKSKITVIFVSHDMNAVSQYCDRAILIEQGRIQDMGMSNVISEKYLKLFNTDKEPPRQATERAGERWGDGKAKIKSIKTRVDSDTISIDYNIEVNDNLEEIVAGFRIRSSDGKDITGTNTLKEKHRIKDIKKGQTIKLKWQMPNIFSDDTYLVDPALVHGDEITVHDWWNEASTFTVNKHRNLPFTIDPGFTVSID